MKQIIFRDQWSNFVILRDETAVTLLNLFNALLDKEDKDEFPKFQTKVKISF